MLQVDQIDLLEAGALVKLIAPEIIEDIELYAEKYKKRINLRYRKYKSGDLKESCLAFSATNDPLVNKKVFKEAEKLNIFCNSVDDIPNCTMILPSVIKKESLQVAVSTSGKSPAMAGRLRRSIEKTIPGNMDEILTCLGEARELLKSGKVYPGLSPTERGKVLKKNVNNDRTLKKLLKYYRKNLLTDFLKSQLKK